MAVGSPYYNDKKGGSSVPGAVYIMTFDDVTGNFTTDQILLGDVSYDYFGTDVALDGNTLLVGAPQYDVKDGTVTRNAAGAAFVYKRNATNMFVRVQTIVGRSLAHCTAAEEASAIGPVAYGMVVAVVVPPQDPPLLPRIFAVPA
jgi:hypothetical protein